MKGSVKIAAAASVIVLAVVAALVLPVSLWLGYVIEWMRGAGIRGVVAFAVVGVLAAVFVVPGAMLGVGAGMAYGLGWGTLLVVPVSVVAATLAFALGRTVARNWVARWVASNPKFQAVDRAIGRHGFKIVVLVRLSPLLPYNLLNYALALTDVRLRDYVIGSFIGMMPGTMLYVYIGSIIGGIASFSQGVSEVSTARYALTGLGLLATVGAAALVTHLAKGALSDELAFESAARLPSEQRQ
jgi:uncharacterized membrane protein YdjX (TVP38/TMEM64 family)